MEFFIQQLARRGLENFTLNLNKDLVKCKSMYTKKSAVDLGTTDGGCDTKIPLIIDEYDRMYKRLI